jgi:glutathione S-transferase
MALTVHHIPVCPFCQRLEILLELKGLRDAIRFEVVDITKPRPPELLAKTRGATALPVLELEDGRVLPESLVLMQYLDQRFPDSPIAERDPYRRAVESLFTLLERDFVATGYKMILNQDPAQRGDWSARMLERYAALDSFLVAHATGDTFLFERFGWAEAVLTPMFQRFWFLEYYEGFLLPDEPRFARVRRYRDACLAHPAAQQVTFEQIVKLYYDYAQGVGNGALPSGRRVSSFAFEPPWPSRPWPPADKYGTHATDAELGLTP